MPEGVTLGSIRGFFSAYRKWRNNWDTLCKRCGKCCYIRTLSPKGEVEINDKAACKYLDAQTKLCRVFDQRFVKYNRCGKVNLFRAMFNRYLPPDCAYVQTFRVWRKNR